MLRRLLLLFSMLVLSLTVQAGPVALYISPKGNDAGDGSKYHPFLTLERARDVIRAIKQHGALPTGGVTVWLRGGVYARTQSFTLTTEDSGTASAPINYRAYGKESVVLTGGKRIANWTPVTDQAVLARLGSGAQGKVLQADLLALGITDFGKLTSRGFSRPISPAHLELYCNNERMVLARWPNDGFSKIAAVPKADGTREVNPQATGNLQQGFFYADDRPARWQSLDDIWVHGYWMYDWANSYEQLATLDTKTHLITTKKPCGIYGFRPNQRIYFVNVLEELDAPGEYYLDRKTGLLYFWPPTPVQQADCDVTLLEQPLISLHDTSFVSFQRLTVEYVRGKAIEITGGTHDVIGGCTVRHIGNWAVMVNGGTQHLVVGCDIYDTGDGGISLSGGDRKTLLPADLAAVNNHIHHFGQWSRCYQPAVMVTGVGNRVAHNVIHDGPHNAIQLGGNDHVIEYNEISRVCLETGDVGAFYMGRDWTQRGNIIRYNYFHDTGGVGMGSMAVYLDDCTSGITVFGNIFYRTTRAAFIGGGCDNVVENNIFVECKPAVSLDGRGLDSSPTWHNMVYDTMRKRLDAMNYHQPPYAERYPELAKLDAYYAANNGVPPVGNKILRNISIGGQWLQVGWHATTDMLELRDNLVDIDPHFVDRSKANFQLQKDSPAFTLGFQPIPVQQIGLYRDQYRR